MSPVIKKKGEKFTLPSKYLLFILTILCAAMVVVTFNTDIFNKPLNYAVNILIVPYQRGISSIGNFMANRKEQLQYIQDLINQNSELQAKVNDLEDEVTRLTQDKYELNTLRSLYELDKTYDTYEKVGARVIFKDSGNWFSTFILDKGYNDGIELDMNVIAGNGLVGRITMVGPDWCKVNSIINDNSNVSGMVLSSSQDVIVSGSLETLNDGVILFSHLIDSDNKVNVGDKIVTSDISDKFLPGIFIGIISEINNDSNNLTKSGLLIPAVDFEHLDDVLIILDKKRNVSEEEKKEAIVAE